MHHERPRDDGHQAEARKGVGQVHLPMGREPEGYADKEKAECEGGEQGTALLAWHDELAGNARIAPHPARMSNFATG